MAMKRMLKPGPSPFTSMRETTFVLLKTEPMLTYLMIIYPSLSWSLLWATRETGAWVLPVASFGALWSAFNTYKRALSWTFFPEMGSKSTMHNMI